MGRSRSQATILRKACATERVASFLKLTESRPQARPRGARRISPAIPFSFFAWRAKRWSPKAPGVDARCDTRRVLSLDFQAGFSGRRLVSLSLGEGGRRIRRRPALALALSAAG
jgi:hypothetical protein